MRRHTPRAGLVALAILLAACAGLPPPPNASPSSAPSSAIGRSSPLPSVAPPSSGSGLPAPSLPADPPIDDLFDVGRYRLAVNCSGSGAPTVVYVHGLGGARSFFDGVRRRLDDRVRVCAYDRVNSGDSDRDRNPHTATDSVRDLDALLAAADVDRPLVLVGASFGGLIALMHAATFPADVEGLVLLDATLPGYDDLLDLIPSAERGGIRAAIEGNVERVDAFASLEEADALIERVPDVAVTYLAATDPLWPSSLPVDKMTDRATEIQESFVGRFSRGRLVTVDAPHVMEPIIPDVIAEEIERVLDAVD